MPERKRKTSRKKKILIGKPKELEIFNDERDVYVFSFKSGYQFGLGGIIGWETRENDYLFYDDEGVAIVVSKEAFSHFMPKPDELKPEVSPEIKANSVKLPDAATEKVSDEGKREVSRYLFRLYKDDTRAIYDTVADSVYPLPPDADIDGLKALVALANQAHADASLRAVKEHLRERAKVKIFISDEDAETSAVISREFYDKCVNNGDYQLIQVPAVQLKDGSTFRIEGQDDNSNLLLRKCTIDIDAPFDPRNLKGTVPK